MSHDPSEIIIIFLTIYKFEVDFFSKKLIFSFSNDTLNGSKVTVKVFIILQKILFQINAVH